MRIPIRQLVESNVVEKTSGELRLTRTFMSWVEAYVRVRPNDGVSTDTWHFILTLFDRNLASLTVEELAGCMMLFDSIMKPGGIRNKTAGRMGEFGAPGFHDRRNHSADA